MDDDKHSFKFRMLPSCNECNVLLGTFHSTSLLERRAELKRRLRSKYKHLCRMPEWDDEELCELDPDLRRNVYLHVEVSRILKKRLGFYPKRGADN